MRLASLAWLIMAMGIAAALYPEQYSEELAVLALRYSSATYCTNETLLWNWECVSCKHVPGLKVVHIFKDKGHENYSYLGVQVEPELRIVLAYRGTVYSTMTSAIADITFWETPWPPNVTGSTVDRGFLDYYNTAEKELRLALKSLLKVYPGAPVWITGHSLGGVSAVMAAVGLSDIISKPLVYTFGSPRAGNSIFVKYYRKIVGRSSYRVIHDHDIVPHLPPCTWGPFGSSCGGDSYPHHVPTEVLYDDPMSSYRICDEDDGEDPECSGKFSIFSYSIEQHLYYFNINVARPEKDEPLIFPPVASGVVVAVE